MYLKDLDSKSSSTQIDEIIKIEIIAIAVIFFVLVLI